MNPFTPGIIVLLGSGETLASSGKAHEFAARRLPQNPMIAILETPAGFELNSDLVAGKIKDFLAVRLTNYSPEIIQVPARKKDTHLSPDAPEIVAPLYLADEILLGPGSPTYAVRQLQNSLAYEIVSARTQMGAALVLSSAATLAFGRFTIPVYEIFKVGEDIHWKEGLDFFGRYHLPLSIVPHWNNNDGGDDLDTSRCYIGKSRFDALYQRLPDDAVVLGIDDHTSLAIDLQQKVCTVMGNGTVTVLIAGSETTFDSGRTFDLALIGEPVIPPAGEGISPAVWAQALAAQQQKIDQASQTPPHPSQEVVDLMNQRDTARLEKDWAQSDRLRDEIKAYGWQVNDTPEGQELLWLG
ncbi:MAG: hypothetical protein JW757_09595 [Anaerolineales bacterium]|nr:hypothetical protein [Anaerolineales bacterium]